MPDHQKLGEAKAQATRQFIARRLLPQKCIQQAEMGETSDGMRACDSNFKTSAH